MVRIDPHALEYCLFVCLIYSFSFFFFLDINIFYTVFPLGFSALPDADKGLAAISYHYYDLPSLAIDLDVAQRVKDGQRLRAGVFFNSWIDVAHGFMV